METLAHRRLKRLAIAHLREQGCLAVAIEVRCPASRYRVDVAGYRDAPRRDAVRAGRLRATRRPADTVVVECKQSRSDFLRDREAIERLHRERRDLEAIARSIEEHRIKREEPHLRRSGSSLFAELEEWEFAGSRLPSYQRVLRRLRRVEQRIYGQTKFSTIARYRLADRLYVAAPEGLVGRSELPQGWGLLECAPEQLGGSAERRTVPAFRETVAAPPMSTAEQHRLRMLRNIAVAASLAAERTAVR